jgi:DNA end-binding protein Ku
MAPRSSWKGFLKLSLVSVPVKGYSATSSGSEIALHQLHSKCHRRIKYQKTCPLHGEVPNDEIVSGYEYAKGEYVAIDPDELDELRTESERRAINVDAIVESNAIDPLYFTGKTYYLLPEGAVGQKPYALIQHCLAEENLQAVARVVLFGHEELVLVRPVEKVLAMTALKYASEVTLADSFNEELEEAKLAKQEVTLTRTLLEALEQRKFSIESYKNQYVERLQQLIEAKVAGKEVVKPPSSEEPHVINLMDALRQSVAKAKRGEPASRKATTHKRVSHAAKGHAKRKRAG